MHTSTQVTPLTKEHNAAVSDLFNPAKVAAAAAQATTDTASSSAGADGPLAPVPGVYALGDCCANADNPLPPLAQVRLGAVGLMLRAICRLYLLQQPDT